MHAVPALADSSDSTESDLQLCQAGAARVEDVHAIDHDVDIRAQAASTTNNLYHNESSAESSERACKPVPLLAQTAGDLRPSAATED